MNEFELINSELDLTEYTYLPDIKSALEEKGVEVPATIRVSDIPAYIDKIGG